jgi:DNA-binding NarL/FixJ family response regulator
MLDILVITQTPLLKKGICSVLKEVPDWRVHSTSGWADPEAIPELARQVTPDVTIIEDANGNILEVFERLGLAAVKSLGMIVVVTCGYQSEEILFRLCIWGVATYINARITPEAFRDTVNRVSHGEYILSADDLHLEPERPEQPQQEQEEQQVPDGCPLTCREREVLTYIALGKTNREIGSLLKISDQTVKNHVTAIHKSLGVKKRIMAVLKALSLGWIAFPEKVPAADAADEALMVA